MPPNQSTAHMTNTPSLRELPCVIRVPSFDIKGCSLNHLCPSRAQRSSCRDDHLLRWAKIRARQRSGEGVVSRNGCPKGSFWRVRFSLPPYGLLLKRLKTLRGQRRNILSKNALLDNRFSTRRLLRSFSAPPKNVRFKNGHARVEALAFLKR